MCRSKPPAPCGARHACAPALPHTRGLEAEGCRTPVACVSLHHTCTLTFIARRCHTVPLLWLPTQCIQQRLRLLEVRRIKPFGEPLVDRCQHSRASACLPCSCHRRARLMAARRLDAHDRGHARSAVGMQRRSLPDAPAPGGAPERVASLQAASSTAAHARPRSARPRAATTRRLGPHPRCLSCSVPLRPSPPWACPQGGMVVRCSPPGGLCLPAERLGDDGYHGTGCAAALRDDRLTIA